jgi:hypothetical protein
MKKINTEFASHLILEIIAIGLVIAGTIIVIASLFGPLPTFRGVVLMISGTILLVQANLYFRLRDTIDTLLKFVEKVGSETSPQKKVNATVIDINDETTPEEIDELKKQFPEIGEKIDAIVQSLKLINPKIGLSKFGKEFKNNIDDKPIIFLTNEELEENLKKAIAEEQYEKALVIKNEIEKRNSK